MSSHCLLWQEHHVTYSCKSIQTCNVVCTCICMITLSVGNRESHPQLVVVMHGMSMVSLTS